MSIAHECTGESESLTDANAESKSLMLSGDAVTDCRSLLPPMRRSTRLRRRTVRMNTDRYRDGYADKLHALQVELTSDKDWLM